MMKKSHEKKTIREKKIKNLFIADFKSLKTLPYYLNAHKLLYIYLAGQSLKLRFQKKYFFLTFLFKYSKYGKRKKKLLKFDQL